MTKLTKENYKEEVLTDLAEQIAYYSFTGQGYEIISKRGYTHEDIAKFTVTFLFFTYEENDVDLLIRFTVYIGEESNRNNEITFILNNKTILNAVINKYFKSELGLFQSYNFEFDRPNSIKLYDAQFCLPELLGIEEE